MFPRTADPSSLFLVLIQIRFAKMGKITKPPFKQWLSIYKFLFKIFIRVRGGGDNLNPLTDLPLIFIGELGRTTGMFLAWF